MRENLVIVILLALLIATSGSVASSSGVHFTTSFESTTIGVTNSVDKISLDVKDTDMTTRYIDDEEPVSLNISVTNVNESKTTNRQYDYEVPEDGKISVNRNIKLSEFDSTDFPLDRKTNLEVRFAVNHPSFEKQVRKNTVSIVEGVDRTSCQTIKQTDSDATSDVYTINPDGEGGVAGFKVYCEMAENGGGWVKLRLDNDVDKNSDNMLWFSKYDTVSEQQSSHDSIGQQFNWNQLKQLSDESQLNSDFSDDGTTYYPEMNNEVVNTNRKVNYEMAGGSGLDYTDAQIQAIRQNIDTLSDTTRMFTHTNDDDNCDPNGEIYTRLLDGGSQYHMTPYTSGNQVSSSQYWDETDFSDKEYLLPTYIDYGDYDDSGCSGSVDHMSWGWEQDYILVK